MEASVSATVLARIVDRIRASSAADAQSSSPRVESVEQLRQAHEQEVAALQTFHQAELRMAQAGGDPPVGLGGARVDTAVKPKREAEEMDVKDVESIKAEDELKPKVEDEALVRQRERSLAPTPAPDRPAPAAVGPAPPGGQGDWFEAGCPSRAARFPAFTGRSLLRPRK